jgi:hypothetical protein
MQNKMQNRMRNKRKKLRMVVCCIGMMTGFGGVGEALGADEASGVTVSSSPQADEATSYWTRERMLIAQPMPMSGEEREWFAKHKSVQQIDTWTFADMQAYFDSEIGRRTIIGEGERYIGLIKMLNKQLVAVRHALKRKPQAIPVQQCDLHVNDPAVMLREMRDLRRALHNACVELDQLQESAAKAGKTKEFDEALGSATQ